MRRLRLLIFLLKDAFKEFRKNDPLRFGASTAFFTTFALPPILVIFINLLGFLYTSDFISEQLILKLQNMFGTRSASQLYYVLQNIQDIPTHWTYGLLGLVFLSFVSTTLFIVVQKSLNELWDIRPKAGKKIRKLFRNRAKSLAIILATGVLFLFSLLADGAISYVGHNLDHFMPRSTALVVRGANIVVSYAIVTAWFALTFKYLPDARIRWWPIWVGAAVTALLFTVGKFIINYLLLNSNLGPIYGPSASVLLIMLFVFYSSMILFYGAAFTRSYAHYAAFKIRPKSYATQYKRRLKASKPEKNKSATEDAPGLVS